MWMLFKAMQQKIAIEIATECLLLTNSLLFHLTHKRPMLPSYRYHSNEIQRKSVRWFLHEWIIGR